MYLKLFLFVVFITGYSDASTKEWLPNVNYDNPDNWNVKRLPCSNDRVKLSGSDDSFVSVFLQSNSTMREVVLPMNGVVTLPSDMVMSFSDSDQDPSCQGEDVEFIRSDAKDWFDPVNWIDPASSVLLETEMVPCSYDDVVFPGGSRYYVQLDKDISLSSLTFAGQSYGTSDFKTFLESEDGKQQFTFGTLGRTPSVSVKGCLDSSGCPCQTDRQIKDRICQNVQCFEPICKNAIIPMDGCCQICGCTLTMLYNERFNLETFKNMIRNNYENKGAYDEVRSSTSKTSEGKIQFVASDDHDGKKAESMCKALKQDIVQHMAAYGVTNVTSTTSEGGTGSQTGARPLETAMIAGIVIAILVVLAIILVIALIYRQGRCGKWPKSLPLSAEMELSSAEFINHPTDPAAVLRGFDNPMYDTPPKSDGSEIATKYNPMYTSAGILDEEDDGTLRGFANPVDIDSAFATSTDDMDLSLKKPIEDHDDTQF